MFSLFIFCLYIRYFFSGYFVFSVVNEAMGLGNIVDEIREIITAFTDRKAITVVNCDKLINC